MDSVCQEVLCEGQDVVWSFTGIGGLVFGVLVCVHPFA
jgi:hypothetical protein